MRPFQSLQRFRIIRLSINLQEEFGLPELICADPHGLPFLEGQSFWAWLVKENACQPATANNYLKSVLQFLTYLWFSSPSLRYTNSVQEIRNRIREYLRQRMGCAIRPHRNGNFLVTPHHTCTKETVRLWLVALRRFYDFAGQAGLYHEVNPFLWAKPLVPRGNGFTPTMPPASGLTLPAQQTGRTPDAYFCVVAGDWQPHIIDDPDLPQRVVSACVSRREQLITRILFESGARVGEVLGLTIGDWRQRGLRERALAVNKGSWGRKVKELWWSAVTSQLLRQYINGERRHNDPARRKLDDLPDSAPIFITDDGRSYQYAAFYYHWRKACTQASLQLHPHQARHWFVTMALRRIESVSDETKRAAYRQALVTYMHWRNPETIRTYDHHLQLASFDATHSAILQLVDGDLPVVARQAAQRASALDEMTQAMWDRLSQLLDEAKDQ